jgi:transcription antitermination factor NusG
MPTQFAWYAVYTKAHRERLVADSLEGKGYECFLPLFSAPGAGALRGKECTQPLFPRYVFVHFDVTNRLPVLMIPGVESLISVAKEPAAIPRHEIDALRLIVSTSVAVAPLPYIDTGTPVTLTGGPLKGLKGILLQHKSTQRLVVGVSMLRRAVSVEVENTWVAPQASCQRNQASTAK